MLFMTTRDCGPVAKATYAHQELFGRFVNPKRRNPNLSGWQTWVGDNGAFHGFDKDMFMRSVKELLPYKSTCKCLTVPDVPFHWAPTLAKFKDWAPSLRRMGFPLGCAVQDGATVENIPWNELDAVFVGGSTQWKREHTPLFGSPVGEIIREAKCRGKWVHVGRSANSVKQVLYAYQLGADSVDGTNECFAPDREFRWIAKTMWSIHSKCA